jgi:hypothetical protein
VRFFRIPGFTGIEAHRDDADRGSLRVVEGCLPHGPGGLRSGPVWKKVGEVSSFSKSVVNQVSANDDGQGNSLVLVSRNCEIRDMVLISNENTDITSFGESYDVALPEGSLYSLENATISSVGNRLYAVGDGSQEAMYIGKGPAQADSFEVYPDETLYKQEWSRFPKCKYYARGPKGSLFASGNPDKPLTVYISEPPGLTASIKDSPYSTEDSVYNSGRLSTVEILGSDASKITALSTRGDQVVVHTDKGSYLLYAPSGDQASTGYRVEQAPATNFSAAINQQVVSGESGTQTFWVGHDGQIYKDEAASRGSADLRSKADEDQANWKSKGVWEHERPVDLSNSFATFEAQTGNYIFFFEEKNYDLVAAPPLKPLSLETSTEIEFNTHYKAESGAWTGITEVECEAAQKTCWARTNENLVPGLIVSSSSDLSSANGWCCSDAGIADCCDFPDNKYKIENCECVEDTSESPQFDTLTECEEQKLIECQSYSLTECNCIPDAAGSYNTLFECETEKLIECQNYSLTDCNCTPDANGIYSTKSECETEKLIECQNYSLTDCNCTPDANGIYSTKSECETEKLIECQNYSLTDCNCIPDANGIYSTKSECETEKLIECQNYSLTDCNCTPDANGIYSTKSECEAQHTIECLNYSMSDDCVCTQNDGGLFLGLTECQTYADSNCEPGSTDFYRLNDESCCVGGYSSGYATYDDCAPFESDSSIAYCKTTGGSDTYSDCGGTPTDYLENCNNNSDCSNCPEQYWDLNTATCTCEPDVRELQEAGYISEGDCIAALAVHVGCETYDLVGCECVISQDATGQYTLEECNAQKALNSDCDPRWLVDCLCTTSDPNDGSSSVGNLADCEAIRDSDNNCQSHWVNNCFCEPNDPGDGTPPYSSWYDCMNNFETDFPSCACDDSSQAYFLDEGDCVFIGEGSGSLTECDCIEGGHTILQ